MQSSEACPSTAMEILSQAFAHEDLSPAASHMQVALAIQSSSTDATEALSDTDPYTVAHKSLGLEAAGKHTLYKCLSLCSPLTPFPDTIGGGQANVIEHREDSPPHTPSELSVDAASNTMLENGAPNIGDYIATMSPSQRSWRFRWARRLRGYRGRNKEQFTRVIKVAYEVGNDDRVSTGVASFDTQCPGDWISARFVRENWGVEFSGARQAPAATTVLGETVYSLGQFNARWRCDNDRHWWSPRRLSFSPRFYSVQFEVIDAENFDVIIGQPSITEHSLLTRNNRIIGLYSAFRPSNPRPGKIVAPQSQQLDCTDAVTTASSISEQQRQADERRAQEAIARAQYEIQEVSLQSQQSSRCTYLSQHTQTDATNSQPQ
jgi:hypothetical protein